MLARKSANYRSKCFVAEQKTARNPMIGQYCPMSYGQNGQFEAFSEKVPMRAHVYIKFPEKGSNCPFCP